MKKVWIEIDDWNKELVTDAIENGVDAFIVKEEKFKEKINKLAHIDVYIKNKFPKNIKGIKITSKEDEERAANFSKDVLLIIGTDDWKIIPIENILSKRDNIFALVASLEEAKESIEIMEKGVDGILIANCENEDKIRILKDIKNIKSNIKLSEGEIISVKKLMIGDRVCIDTISNMKNGEGMLVGDYSHGMVLVNSESMENDYVDSRPFRVNAGAVHSYIMCENNKMRYLSDLKSGENVLIVNGNGDVTKSVIGRIKEERRPLLRVEIKGKLRIFSVILQNAETVRLVTKKDTSKSVLDLNKGDKVLIYEESGGRHFGNKIKESIEER
jgi:3-dehydroquinate synthase II